MKRYLLFDSGCSLCSKLAADVEQESGGWLEARTLRDPAMQELLNKANPDWRWAPTYLEVSGGKVRIYTGFSMALRLVTKLGLRQTLRLVKLVNRSTGSTATRPPDMERRQFLRLSGGSFLAALSLLIGLPSGQTRYNNQRSNLQDVEAGPAQPDVVTESPGGDELQDGELYAGFLLLPEGAPLPCSVQSASAPILCHTANRNDLGVRAFIGETLWFDSIDGLTNTLSFRTYIPAALPANIVFVSGYIIRFAQSGEVFEARSDFGSAESQEPLVSLSTRPLFPEPYPIWPVRHYDGTNQEQAEIVASPEKVSFLPSPGVMLPTDQGHAFHWIKNDILYGLVVEHDRHRDAAVSIATSLVEI